MPDDPRRKELLDAVGPAVRRAFERIIEPPLLRSSLGLHWHSIDPVRMVQSVAPVPGWQEADGRLSIGALAALVDSTASSAGALSGGYSHGITVSLRVELAEPLSIPAMPVTAATTVARADRVGSLVTAVLDQADGSKVGIASLRALGVEAEDAGDRSHDTSALAIPAAGSRAAYVDGTLGVTNESRCDGKSRITVHPGAELANANGRLHGGVVAALVNRGGRSAIVGVLDKGETIADLVLDVDFLRPVPPGDVLLVVEGNLLARTRRYAWAQSEIRRPDGRVAAIGRTIVRIHPDG
jgi:uncharacterized protein (TIGR00369 family)